MLTVIMSQWEEQLVVVLDTFLRLPPSTSAASTSSLSPSFRAALLQSEQPQALLFNGPQLALHFCSPAADSSCKEGVPAHPLCRQLARTLCEWMASSTFPRTLESIPGLSEDKGLEDKVKAWAGKILKPLATLQELIQGVKLHLQVEEPLFSQLRDAERPPDATFFVVEESSAAEPATTIKTHNSLTQGNVLLLNNVVLHEVQTPCGFESWCLLSNTKKIIGALMFAEDGSDGENIFNQYLGDTIATIHAQRMPEIKQPLKIVETILKVLDIEGVKALLGFRSTIGTIRDALPPPRSLLLASFVESSGAEVAGTKLTVGGRALAKHVHRSSSGWWGSFTGNDERKNELALRNITYLIQHASWMNVHFMPPESLVFELRVREGYGARWTADGKKFRGFLEPQMVDGHAKKWRH